MRNTMQRRQNVERFATAKSAPSATDRHLRRDCALSRGVDTGGASRCNQIRPRQCGGDATSQILPEGTHAMTRLQLHRERHLVSRVGWLRAAVLGANDGLVSTASLVVGVAAV